MSIFEGLPVGRPWKVINVRNLTPLEYLWTVSATVVRSQYGYSVEFLTKDGGKYYVPLSLRCFTDDMTDLKEGISINPCSIKVLTLEDRGDTIIQVEF